MNIKHSSAVECWYTPTTIIESARTVLEGIDFDPASDEFGNSRIKAGMFLSEADDSLSAVWPSDVSVFLNPPGGKVGNKSQQVLFWMKLMENRATFKHAIFIGFSIEILQSSQNKGVPNVLEFPICIPSKRVAFDLDTGSPTSPSHGNVIAYIRGSIDNTESFIREFSKHGACK